MAFRSFLNFQKNNKMWFVVGKFTFVNVKFTNNFYLFIIKQELLLVESDS